MRLVRLLAATLLSLTLVGACGPEETVPTDGLLKHVRPSGPATERGSSWWTDAAGPGCGASMGSASQHDGDPALCSPAEEPTAPPTPAP
ncbi:hypothetical protein [Aeromicrobium sp. Leaf350]|uniref:hypothetical protein n=1 Tax=Aeromicrobium sp. Leaf350 TaxID=2876565 RepID=UPI001E35A04E|nr:hypothetical protein [Aeromicrobium sp. Leaf350]